METQTNVKSQTNSLVVRLAVKYGVNADKLLKTLTTQVFKQSDGSTPTNEELMVLLLVCENYGLNPFAREIFAFRGKNGDVVPVVSLDGWCRIVRSQKDFNGVSFTFSDTTVKVPGCSQELPEYVQCAMRIKGVDEPVVIQEFMAECFVEKSPVWRRWPRRMLRTRAFIQCARLAFSLTGLYDEVEEVNEAAQTITGEAVEKTEPSKINVARQKLDGMIDRIISYVDGHADGWQRAVQWIETKLEGEDRSYAMARLESHRPAAQPVETVKVIEPGEAENEEVPHAHA